MLFMKCYSGFTFLKFKWLFPKPATFYFVWSEMKPEFLSFHFSNTLIDFWVISSFKKKSMKELYFNSVAKKKKLDLKIKYKAFVTW